MATIETRYLGDLRTEMKHLQSGSVVLTDARQQRQRGGVLSHRSGSGGSRQLHAHYHGHSRTHAQFLHRRNHARDNQSNVVGAPPHRAHRDKGKHTPRPQRQNTHHNRTRCRHMPCRTQPASRHRTRHNVQLRQINDREYRTKPYR